MPTDARDPRIPARDLFEQLRDYGLDPNQLIHVASELIALITCSIRESGGSDDSPEPRLPADGSH
ncbi:hypothetical protein NR798_42035 [Archangium gephyra]|uniref:hypothetical protein n=1 Tax=Archangium gephyra TaxID=48 RepID=UPI0035D48C50